MIDRRLHSHLEPIACDLQSSKLWRAVAGCWAVAGLAGLGLVFLKWTLQWSSPWPFLVLLVSALLAVGIIVARLRKYSMDFQALARRIEEENPQLQALLLTAVEQQPLPDTSHLNYLQQRVIEQALEHHRQQPWDRGVSARLSSARRMHWFAFCFFLVVLAGLRPHVTTVRGIRAEQSNGVFVTPGDTTIERGSGLVVLARFDGKLPTEATLVVKPLNTNEFRIPLTKNLEDPVFGGSLSEVSRDMVYHIEFTSGHTRDFKVGVFDYPKLDRADVKVAYPAYTGLPEKTIKDTRRVSAVEGSALDFTFYLNKPVTTAKLVAKDKTVIPLSGDTANAGVYHAQLSLEQTRRMQLVLVDGAGRTNKLPPEFVLEALKNRPPELKLALPRGDLRVSPLEEIAFQAQVSDDFGLHGYGVAYTLAGQETKVVELGQKSGPNEKRQFNYLLALEGLAAQPDQLLSYYVWADDMGPDGKPRRTSSDLFFAEIRPFDEVFREGQSPAGNNANNNNQGGENSGQQGGNPTQKLAELQKQIISATWNLQRRENGATPSKDFKKDAAVIQQSQQEALDQAQTRMEQIEDPRLKAVMETVQTEMKKAVKQLSEAADQNVVKPLSPALSSEQSASQALLRLQAHEYQVAMSRNQRNQRSGSSSGSQSAQRQVDQLELTQTDNRYETQRQPAQLQSQTQNPQQREQLQVLNRLKELAQRQQDLNERLKELQTALQEAKTAEERADVSRRLKRLREEQQEMLADVDELRQRMEQPQNQSRMAEARQQLEQTRSDVQRAGEALDKESVPQALASGTRAQRELQQMRDDFRKQTSGQFTEEMRKMRDEARQLAQKEDEIAKKLGELGDTNKKTLSDQEDRRALASQMTEQKNSLTNLFTEMRQVSEQSETAEPLLSEQLYDLLRQTNQDELNKRLELTSELVRRGFLSQASPFEQRARRDIDDIKQGVERAAESVLGNEADALRLAKRELEDLSQQLDRELAQADPGSRQNQPGDQSAQTSNSGTNQNSRTPGQNQQANSARDGTPQQSQGERGQPSASGNPSQSDASAQANQPNQGNRGNRGSQANQSNQGNRGSQANQANQGNRGNQGNLANRGNQPNRLQDQSARGSAQRGGNTGSTNSLAQNGNQRPGQRNGARAGGGQYNFDQNGGYSDGRGGVAGPLVGDDFVDWTDRLRGVEEMLDLPDLRTDVARIRDRARAVRLDYKRFGKKPDWAVVRLQISAPLAEVRSRVADELARRESNDALVPIDRDPVPTKYSELVRRYYERLGKTD